MIASGLLIVLLTGLLPIVATARVATSRARRDVLMSLLAGRRLAEIGALTHLRLPAGIVRDEAAHLGGGDVFAEGGTGLRETGIGALEAPTPGASDWLDDRGRWDGEGPVPGPAGRYLRQWGLVTGPEGCVEVWVRVSVPSSIDEAFAGGLQCPWGGGPS
ncbi:hypothetical protein TBR22_A37840 [Luteitalea sp. TBR-22]|nr:hypothetical protein TBR22_A37840 [Luteitalea sp. TBR-22]